MNNSSDFRIIPSVSESFHPTINLIMNQSSVNSAVCLPNGLRIVLVKYCAYVPRVCLPRFPVGADKCFCLAWHVLQCLLTNVRKCLEICFGGVVPVCYNEEYKSTVISHGRKMYQFESRSEQTPEYFSITVFLRRSKLIPG
jgi:hypothetical protein